MQELVDGYNLTYNFSCTYLDQDAHVRDCAIDGGIEDETKNLPYTFWIEQVTSTNAVTHSFTVNRLFFMLDSMNMINILQLHNDEVDNLDDINLQSLDSIKTYRQVDILGCNITVGGVGGYAE